MKLFLLEQVHTSGLPAHLLAAIHRIGHCIIEAIVSAIVSDSTASETIVLDSTASETIVSDSTASEGIAPNCMPARGISN